MDRFCWMFSRSFKHCVLIWLVLDGLLHHLLLIMSPNCPLAIHHKKGEYIVCMHGDRESFGAALDCIYVVFMYMFLACDVFIVYELYMLGEDTFFYFILYILCFIASCFTYDTFVIDLYYEVIHDICLLFSVL